MVTVEPLAKRFVYEGKDLEAMDFAQNYHDWILSKFDPFIGQRLLEVGAGVGSVSKMILERYRKETWMVEPSEQLDLLRQNLVSREHNRLAHPVPGFLADNLDHLKQLKIDTVFYVNVMEHIRDDQAELDAVFDLLKPGGHILTFSPALPWLYGKFDRRIGHFRRYTLRDMKEKMRTAGYEVVKGHYVDFPGMLVWWLMFRVFKFDRLTGTNVGLYDKIVIPILRWLDPSRILPWGKNLLVVGKKPENASVSWWLGKSRKQQVSSAPSPAAA
jgi:SAM-dependent methyltransferase